MRYFRPDPFTRAAVAIPDMAGQSAFISAGDICNRALVAALSPGRGTNGILERGTASGVEWMECPGFLWAAVQPQLQGIEVSSVTTTRPSGYVRSVNRVRMSRYTSRGNLVAITDSLGFNDGGTGVGGLDSYVTKAFQAWTGSTTVSWGANPTIEFVSGTKALLHNGNPGSFFEGGDVDAFDNDHTRMWPVKYTTLGLGSGDIIYVALGTNDFSNTLISTLPPTAAQVWARAQVLIGGLASDFPAATIIVATLPRRTNNSTTNNRHQAFNNYLKAGYAALGVDAICDIEQAHPNFATTGGDADGPAYLDGTHFSDVGIAAAAAALEATLGAI